MPLVTHVKQYGSYNYVIEDPENKRIFIENQSFNTEDLSGRLGEFFEHTDNNGNWAPNGAGANWYDWPVVITNGKYGNSWADSRQAWPGGPGKWDPWILSLDYTIIPKRIFRYGQNGLLYMFYPRDITTNNMRQDIRVSEELTSDVAIRQTTNDLWLYFLYEREGGTLIGFNRENDYNYVAFLDLQVGEVDQSPASVSAVNLQGAASVLNFFIGVDYNNYSGFFLAYNCNTHAYDIYQQGSPTTTNGENVVGYGADSLYYSAGTGGYTGVCYQFPSNLTKDGDTKFFYSSHWDASGILSPKIITWDISSGTFSSKNCTITYPGTETYSTYGAPPTNNNFSASTNSVWWIKPHIVNYGSAIKFITFCTLEKSIQYYYNERWFASQQQRNWITYSINPTDPSSLTYHSHVEWPNTWEFPRSWVPVNDNGTEMLVMLNGKTVFMEFDLDNGWQITNTQSIDARAYGIDSTGRIYLVTRGMATSRMTGGTADAYRGVGWNSIYYFDRHNPYNNVDIKYKTGDGDTKEIKFEVDSTTYVTYGDNGIFPVIRRGTTYKIDTSAIASSHPLAIRYADGDLTPVVGAPEGNSVTGSYGEVFDFTVPLDAPNTLVYQCINHQYMIGTLTVVDPPRDTNVIEFLNNGFTYEIVGYSGTYPTLVLRRGQRYTIDLSGVSPQHPMSFRISSLNETIIPWITSTNAVTGDFSKIFDIIVPYDAPDALVYQCVSHPLVMIGQISIVDASLEISVDNRKLLADYGNYTNTTAHPFSLDHPLYYSHDFDGTGDKLISSCHDDFNFRTGDFTVEFWLWSRVAWSSQTNLCGVVGQKTGDTPYQGWQIYRNSAQSLKMAVRYAGNNDFYSTEDVASQTWAHWALVRNNGTMYWYKDGVQCGSVASTDDIYDYTANFNIAFSQTWGVHFNGIISNLRICKGLAVYTNNFTPPTSPLKARQAAGTNISAIDGECVLLTCNTNQVKDYSGYVSTDITLSSDNDEVLFINQNDDSLNTSLTVTTDSSYPITVAISRSSGDALSKIRMSYT